MKLVPAHAKMLDSSLLFQQLEDESRQTLLTLCRPRELANGEMLFMENDRTDSFFFILQGKMKEYYIGPDGGETVIQVSREGEYLALPALFFRDGCHTSFAESVGRSTVAVFEAASFLDMLRREPAINRNILTLLSFCLECARRQRCFCQKMTAEARVAHYLLIQSDSQLGGKCELCSTCGCRVLNLRPLNLSAQEIGLARETFTRVLTRLKQDGLIDLNRGRVSLLDLQAIEDIARSK